MRYSNACVRNMENELYRIQYTPLAFEDLDGIDTYISETLCNAVAAERLIEQMEKSINQLKQFPYMGSKVEDEYLAAKGYRKLVVENYLIFHLIDEPQREVIIMRVIYGAREYHNLL